MSELYKIVTSKSIEGLEEKVNAFLSFGWKTQGGIYNNNNAFFHQVIIKQSSFTANEKLYMEQLEIKTKLSSLAIKKKGKHNYHFEFDKELYEIDQIKLNKKNPKKSSVIYNKKMNDGWYDGFSDKIIDFYNKYKEPLTTLLKFKLSL
ncbi:MAG: hypothetical protein CMF41_01280 [Legionellales bacterium]|nr:hypothetical protein [Legionellales bacterium]|tara:strand:- start:494 stop:937 length:444 start_codon:yes stop_codon:yes gene_type:complete